MVGLLPYSDIIALAPDSTLFLYVSSTSAYDTQWMGPFSPPLSFLLPPFI